MKAESFDVLVAGGSVAGCLAALDAADKGLNVILIEPRTYLGREFTATLRPWIGLNGWAETTGELRDLLGIAGQLVRQADQGGEEVPLDIGRLKKSLLDRLRAAGVKVLFMTGPAGLLVSRGRLGGAIVGGKSGLLAIEARSVIDATDNLVLARLAGAAVPAAGPRVVRRTLAFASLHAAGREEIALPVKLGVWENKLILRPGMPEEQLGYAEFALTMQPAPGGCTDRMEGETEARLRSIEICDYVRRHVPAFQDAVLVQASGELWPPPVFKAGVSCPYPNLFALDTDPLLLSQQSLLAIGNMRTAAGLAVRAAMEFLQGSGNGEEPFSGMQALLPHIEAPFQELQPVRRRDGIHGIPYYALCLKQKELKQLPKLDVCPVVVVGGGTSGAPAAIAAARSGASVTVIEGMSGLGGTGTIGGINTYWYGYQGGFTAELDGKVEAVTRRISSRINRKRWNIEAKMAAYLEELTRERGNVRFGTQVVEVIRSEAGRKLEGVVVLGPDGLAVIQGEMFIDATGDGDLAALAGVPFVTGEARGGNLQTFNLCGWTIQDGLNGVNLDLGVMDVGHVFDATRGIILGHEQGGRRDFSPYPAVRESRHIAGEYTLQAADVLAGRNYPDTIAVGYTDFDQHGLQSSDYAKLGYMPYHQDFVEIRLPYRVCLPKEIDNMLVAGKAFSSERDAFSFMRMQPDLQNMGYAVGLAAAMALQAKAPARDVPLDVLQRRLLDIGILRQQDLQHADCPEPVEAVLGEAVQAGPSRALLRLICMTEDEALPGLRACFRNPVYAQARLIIAQALAWFGSAEGVDELLERLKQLQHQPQISSIDNAGRPIGGFVGEPDPYWETNQLITLLGRAGDPKALVILCEMAGSMDAGGPPRKHARLHWRRIPHYDRIICLCQAIEQLAGHSAQAASALESLLNKPHIGGFRTSGLGGEGQYASAYLELVIARTLAGCGGEAGFRVLAHYLDDTHAVLSDHAYSELKRLTDKDFGRCRRLWSQWVDEIYLANDGQGG